IRETTTPAWIHSVPHNYGDASAGTIKADEWRLLSTLYLPIALVTLWGDHNGRGPTKDSKLLSVLNHAMALFQAVSIICRITIDRERAEAFRDLLKEWVDGLHTVHPHTKSHHPRPNIHIAFHIFDFLLFFGPVHSWWTFPFERLIGTLQKINTNNHPGGKSL
ncbi:hypothetical protein BDZ89DRAFT_961096, partial [Hymenopellis radicata]